MDDREAYEFYADPAHLEVAGPPVKRRGQRLASMTSVRFAPEVIEAVKDRAFAEGVTVGRWIRRLVDREITEPPTADLTVDGETVRIPAGALQQVAWSLLPLLLKRGSVDLRLGAPGWQVVPPVCADRPEGVIEDSGRTGESRTLLSSLTGHTFTCPHMSIGNVTFAECGECGPLSVAA